VLQPPSPFICPVKILLNPCDQMCSAVRVTRPTKEIDVNIRRPRDSHGPLALHGGYQQDAQLKETSSPAAAEKGGAASPA
jgi:hypothetical protein